jgi:phosphoserine phosphatase RsbU/P
MEFRQPRIANLLTRMGSKDSLVTKLLSAIEYTGDSIFITDRRGVIVYVNPAFEETTGFSHDEAEGQTPRILKSGVQAQDHYREMWDTILRGEVFRKLIINRKKCGEVYYADQTITPTRDRNGEITHFISVIKDMTDYRQIQEQEMEMRIAAQVQQKLYPQKAPVIDGFDIAGAAFPSTATCGDYFDYIQMPDDTLGLAIGDVSGHGIGPALIMAQTRAYLRSFAQDDHKLEQILNRLNCVLFDDIERHRFMTMLLARIDPKTRRLKYTSAGHDCGYILDNGGVVKIEMNSTGLPLGVLKDSAYGSSQWIDLEKGDIVFLCTDGLTESQAHLNRFLDICDCLNMIQENRDKPAADIVQAMYKKVVDFSGGVSQNDDITIVIAKVK